MDRHSDKDFMHMDKYWKRLRTDKIDERTSQTAETESIKEKIILQNEFFTTEQ